MTIANSHDEHCLSTKSTQNVIGQKKLSAPLPQDNKPVLLIAGNNSLENSDLAIKMSASFDVLIAAKGDAAMSLVTSKKPDIIVADVSLPVVDGFEFCKRIKETKATWNIGFILITAKLSVESKLRGLELGADDCLSKPYAMEEMMLRIKNLQRRHERLKEVWHQAVKPVPPKSESIRIEDAFLQMVYNSIEKNLGNNYLDVEMLAKLTHVSRRTLNRRLAILTNLSANQLIRNYRLRKAGDLLKQGYNINEVSFETGFSTASRFIKCFKEMYGMTPSLYTAKASVAQN